MLSHPPPNRQSPASFDQVTRLPPKNASAPLGYPDAQWPDIPAPLVIPIRYMFADKNRNDPWPATWSKAPSPGVGFSAVAILGGGWLQSPASDGPPRVRFQGLFRFNHGFGILHWRLYQCAEDCQISFTKHVILPVPEAYLPAKTGVVLLGTLQYHITQGIKKIDHTVVTCVSR